MDHVEDRPPSPPLVPDLALAADNGVVTGVGPGPAVPGILVPDVAPPPAQTPVFGAHAGLQLGGHQNILQHTQAGQLHQDQLHLFQQALVSVQGMPPGFLAGSSLAGGDPTQLPIFQKGLGAGLPGQGFIFNFSVGGEWSPP